MQRRSITRDGGAGAFAPPLVFAARVRKEHFSEASKDCDYPILRIPDRTSAKQALHLRNERFIEAPSLIRRGQPTTPSTTASRHADIPFS